MTFKDADLLGMPIRVTVGNAFVCEGVVEIRNRAARSECRVGKALAVQTIRDMAEALSGH